MINSAGNVSYYRAPLEGNPWAENLRITCLVSVEGDRLAYVHREARKQSSKYLWLASRTSGDFPEAVGYQDFNNDFEYEDVAINPVDGYAVVSISRWWYWRTETQFMLVSADGSTATEPNISCSSTDRTPYGTAIFRVSSSHPTENGSMSPGAATVPIRGLLPVRNR